MRKILLSLVIMAVMNLAAASATIPETPWSLLVQAGGLPATDSPRCSSMTPEAYPPYSKQWRDMTWDSEQNNAKQFQLLRQSRLLMQSNGGHSGMAMPRTTTASIKTFGVFLNPSRNLANIVSDAADFSHINGNDAEAIGRLMDNFNIAACFHQSNLMLGQLVGVGIEAIGTSNTESIAPNLRLTGPSAAETRKQTTQLIAWLLDEHSLHQQWRETFAYELQSAEHPELGPGAVVPQVAISPAQVAHDLPLLDKASEFQSIPASTALLIQCSWPSGFAPMAPLFLTQFRILADRRMAATDLAIQLYRANHDGNWPKSLDELVPKYLPAVPRDPFRADSPAVGYKIIPHGWGNGKDRPVLFVDAGPDTSIGPTPHFSWYHTKTEQVRQYRDLTLPK